VAEGIKEGPKKGIKKGRQEGELLLLQRQLAFKFGPPDEASLARLAAADSDTLLGWGERVLTTANLAAVFDAPVPREDAAIRDR